MSILILGANGQIGQELLRALQPLGPIVAATRSGRLPDGGRCEAVDFTSPDSVPVLLDRLRPTRVVNAAAYTAVDRAEQERDAAFVVNAEAPAAIARWCARHGVRLVHYSTDYVFDGESDRPYRVDARTAPVNVYGESKLAGELAIRGAGAPHLIFRTEWVYAAHGNNFLRTMLRLGAERDELRVVADQIGTPTAAALIAEVTALALRDDELGRSGTWHLTAAGETTWQGFAREIFDQALAMGLIARKPEVIGITTSEYPTPARRPAYSRLDTTTLERDFDVALPDWRLGVTGVLKAMLGGV